MITYGWGRGLSARPDVSALRAEAAAHDAEQGFVPLSPRKSADDRDVWELLVQLRRPTNDVERPTTWRNAAYLSVTADGDAEFVVRPEFRSVGVATSLAEQLGTEPEKPGTKGPACGESVSGRTDPTRPQTAWRNASALLRTAPTPSWSYP
jgi:mycothiol synthase